MKKFDWNTPAVIAAAGIAAILLIKPDIISGISDSIFGKGDKSSGTVAGGVTPLVEPASIPETISKKEVVSTPTNAPNTYAPQSFQISDRIMAAIAANQNPEGLTFVGIASDGRPVYTPTIKNSQPFSTVVQATSLPGKYWIDTTGGKSVTIQSKIPQTDSLKKGVDYGAGTPNDVYNPSTGVWSPGGGQSPINVSAQKKEVTSYSSSGEAVVRDSSGRVIASSQSRPSYANRTTTFTSRGWVTKY